MSCLEVIVLQKLLVLQMPVLSLNSVKLVTQGQVIFVSLLDFKDFGLQLRNEQVLLVGRQVHAIVILRQRGKSTAHAYVLESYTTLITKTAKKFLNQGKIETHKKVQISI